jgi:subtilisin family serine protease
MPSLGVDCFTWKRAPDVAMERLVEEMARDARVESVQSVNLFHLLAHNDPLFALQPTAKLWHLAEIHQITTGKNVRVAEIDSGVDRDHPDLRDRVAIARNFVDGRDAVAETHGTAVAGIIAARADDGVGIVGVAPQSVLMALRACWQTPVDGSLAVCSSFTLAKALQFALDQNTKVINLSLAVPRSPLGRLLNVAMTRGVVIVAPRINSKDGRFPASVTGVLPLRRMTRTICPQRSWLPARISRPRSRAALGNGKRFIVRRGEVAGLVALIPELAPDRKPRQIRETLASSKITASSPTVMHRRCLCRHYKDNGACAWMLDGAQRRSGSVSVTAQRCAAPLPYCSVYSQVGSALRSRARQASFPTIAIAESRSATGSPRHNSV